MTAPDFTLEEHQMENEGSNLNMPRHIALILDGNGRWAKKRGLPRTAGHKQGCVTLEQIVEDRKSVV